MGWGEGGFARVSMEVVEMNATCQWTAGGKRGTFKILKRDGCRFEIRPYLG